MSASFSKTGWIVAGIAAVLSVFSFLNIRPIVFAVFDTLVFALLAYISYTDITWRKITKKSTALLGICSIASVFVYSIPLLERVLSLVMVFICCELARLLVTKGLNGKKAVGAGDLRMYLCVSFMFGYWTRELIILQTLIAIPLLLFLLIRSKGKSKLVWIPLGPIISLSVVILLLYLEANGMVLPVF